MIRAKRRLVFHFYFGKDFKKSEVTKLHLKLLKYYHHLFDEALFVLCPDSLKGHKAIRQMQNAILDCGFENVQFKVKENSTYRESLTFKEEITDKLSALDGITCFGHSKGVGNEIDGVYNMDNVKTWVKALYYLTLNFDDEVEEVLPSLHYLSYGPLQFKCPIEWRKTVNNMHYAGTFMWLNCQAIYDRTKFTEKPSLANRFYSEDFCGNAFDAGSAFSHEGLYMTEWYAPEKNIDAIVKALLRKDDEYEKWQKFSAMIDS